MGNLPNPQIQTVLNHVSAKIDADFQPAISVHDDGDLIFVEIDNNTYIEIDYDEYGYQLWMRSYSPDHGMSSEKELAQVNDAGAVVALIKHYLEVQAELDRQTAEYERMIEGPPISMWSPTPDELPHHG